MFVRKQMKSVPPHQRYNGCDSSATSISAGISVPCPLRGIAHAKTPAVGTVVAPETAPKCITSVRWPIEHLEILVHLAPEHLDQP